MIRSNPLKENVGSCTRRPLFAPKTPEIPDDRDGYASRKEGRCTAIVDLPNGHPGHPELLCRGCGKKCVVRTSRTVANPGRDFYTCTGGCKMFQWCDAVGKIKTSATNSPVKYNSPVMPVQNFGTAMSRNPSCICGAGPCTVETWKKEPFKGREYYVCYLQRGEGACTHFQWCDSSTIEVYPGTMRGKVNNAITASPTTPTREHETNSSKAKSLDGSPSKRKHFEYPVDQCNMKSLNLSCYLNGETPVRAETKFQDKESLFSSKKLNYDNEAEPSMLKKCVLCGELGHVVEQCMLAIF